MMYDPNLFMESARAHERELTRKAELARQLKDGRDAQPTVPERVLLAVADALISAGERMREGHSLPTSQ